MFFQWQFNIYLMQKIANPLQSEIQVILLNVVRPPVVKKGKKANLFFKSFCAYCVPYSWKVTPILCEDSISSLKTLESWILAGQRRCSSCEPCMRAQLVVSLGNTLGDGVERRVCGGRREREREMEVDVIRMFISWNNTWKHLFFLAQWQLKIFSLFRYITKHPKGANIGKWKMCLWQW